MKPAIALFIAIVAVTSMTLFKLLAVPFAIAYLGIRLLTLDFKSPTKTPPRVKFQLDPKAIENLDL